MDPEDKHDEPMSEEESRHRGYFDPRDYSHQPIPQEPAKKKHTRTRGYYDPHTRDDQTNS